MFGDATSMRAPPRPARVDFTPVMWKTMQGVGKTMRGAARRAGESSSAQKLKQTAKDLLKDVAEELGKKQMKKEGNKLRKEAEKQVQQAVTPEKQVKLTPDKNGNVLSPLSTSPIRTPNKHRREERKRRDTLLREQRRIFRQRQETMRKRLEDLQMSPSDE